MSVSESSLHDCQVLRFAEWVKLAGISPRTGKRLIAAGKGPAVTRLSERRIGISVASHKAWLASRQDDQRI